MSDESPERPKPYYAGREYDFDQPEPGVDTNGGPFVLVNVEELEREIDRFFSSRVEELERLKVDCRSEPGIVNRLEVAHLGGKVDGYKELHEKTLELLRRAAGGVR